MKNSFDGKLKFLLSIRYVQFIKNILKNYLINYFFLLIFRLNSLSPKKGNRTGNAGNHLEQKVLTLLQRIS